MKKVYSEKETAAFDGLMKLVDSGANLSSVTVSDIAESAGVGKGTLYLYFKSKDDIIANALLYFVERGLETAIKAVEEEESFTQKIERIFDLLESISGKKTLLIRFLFYRPEPPKDSVLTNEVRSSIERYRARALDSLYQIALCGSREGLFACPQDKEAVGFTFGSVILGYFQLCCSADVFSNLETFLKKGRENAYSLLLKGFS